MRKPRGGQILANRVIGPREVLGGGDRRVPAKGRGRTEPHRGRSGASWIWSTPLHTGASEGEFRSGYALTPSPSHSKNISFFTERRTSERTVSEDGYSSFLFNPLWGFPVVAAGILFVVDHTRSVIKHRLRNLQNDVYIFRLHLLCDETAINPKISSYAVRGQQVNHRRKSVHQSYPRD